MKRLRLAALALCAIVSPTALRPADARACGSFATDLPSAESLVRGLVYSYYGAVARGEGTNALALWDPAGTVSSFYNGCCMPPPATPAAAHVSAQSAARVRTTVRALRMTFNGDAASVVVSVSAEGVARDDTFGLVRTAGRWRFRLLALGQPMAVARTP